MLFTYRKIGLLRLSNSSVVIPISIRIGARDSRILEFIIAICEMKPLWQEIRVCILPTITFPKNSPMGCAAHLVGIFVSTTLLRGSCRYLSYALCSILLVGRCGRDFGGRRESRGTGCEQSHAVTRPAYCDIIKCTMMTRVK